MYPPKENLKKYVQCYWILDTTIQPNKILTQKIISDGSNGLIFNIASPIDITIDKKNITNLSNILITGSTMKPTYLTIKNKTKLIGIRFNIGGSYPFFQDNLNKYKDNVSNFNNIEWNRILNILKNLSETDKIVKILDEFLSKIILKEKIASTNLILEAVKLIFQDNNIRKKYLCTILNISERQLERKFKEVIGLTFIQISSVIKIHNARKIIRKNEFLSLTQVGYDCNYFDQSHFIKEFKKFTNTTPKKYHKEKNYCRKNTIM